MNIAIKKKDSRQWQINNIRGVKSTLPLICVIVENVFSENYSTVYFSHHCCVDSTFFIFSNTEHYTPQGIYYQIHMSKVVKA